MGLRGARLVGLDGLVDQPSRILLEQQVIRQVGTPDRPPLAPSVSRSAGVGRQAHRRDPAGQSGQRRHGKPRRRAVPKRRSARTFRCAGPPPKSRCGRFFDETYEPWMKSTYSKRTTQVALIRSAFRDLLDLDDEESQLRSALVGRDHARRAEPPPSHYRLSANCQPLACSEPARPLSLETDDLASTVHQVDALGRAGLA
jgi:hypothetical protein